MASCKPPELRFIRGNTVVCCHFLHHLRPDEGIRDALLKYLADENIYCGIHYPVPIHLQTAYSNMGVTNNNLKVSERIATELLSLPMFPELKEEQQIKVSDKIKEFIGFQTSDL